MSAYGINTEFYSCFKHITYETGISSVTPNPSPASATDSENEENYKPVMKTNKKKTADHGGNYQATFIIWLPGSTTASASRDLHLSYIRKQIPQVKGFYNNKKLVSQQSDT